MIYHTKSHGIISNWDFSRIVSRAVRDGLDAAAAPGALEELKTFLLECAISDADLAPQSKACDALWHAFILDTRSYTAFCQEVYGGYLHHDTNADEETLDAARQNTKLALNLSGNEHQAALCGRVTLCGRIALCGRVNQPSGQRH